MSEQSPAPSSEPRARRRGGLARALLAAVLSIMPPELRTRRDDPLFPPAATLVVGEPTPALGGLGPRGDH